MRSQHIITHQAQALAAQTHLSRPMTAWTQRNEQDVYRHVCMESMGLQNNIIVTIIAIAATTHTYTHMYTHTHIYS